jgi:hypothetical protein
VTLTLKGTALSVTGSLPARTLRQLAQWAVSIGSIVINGQSFSAETLNLLAVQSERSGQPIRFEEIPESPQRLKRRGGKHRP